MTKQQYYFVVAHMSVKSDFLKTFTPERYRKFQITRRNRSPEEKKCFSSAELIDEYEVPTNLLSLCHYFLMQNVQQNHSYFIIIIFYYNHNRYKENTDLLVFNTKCAWML